MTASPLGLLVATAGAVGVLHTIVPDHWAPIAVIARQRHWTRRQTAWAAARAGFGHTISTIFIGVIAWVAGAVAAARIGSDVNIAAGIALIGFGLWTVIAAIREQHAVDPLPKSADTTSSRTALLLILGSSPSVEVLPAFLAAAPQGVMALVSVSIVFAIATIATYIVTCALSVAGLEQLRFPFIERYGEVISGGFVMLVGCAFLLWFR